MVANLLGNSPRLHQGNYTNKEPCKFDKDLSFGNFIIEPPARKFKLFSKVYNLPYPVFVLPRKLSFSESVPEHTFSFAQHFVNKMLCKF